jgi:hypothetical protein
MIGAIEQLHGVNFHVKYISILHVDNVIPFNIIILEVKNTK